MELYNATGCRQQSPEFWQRFGHTIIETKTFVPFEDFDRIESIPERLAALIPEKSNVLLGEKQLFNDSLSLLLLKKGCRLYFIVDKHKNVLSEPAISAHGIKIIETPLNIFYRSLKSTELRQPQPSTV